MATWNANERDAAISKGQNGGKLTDHERSKLMEASKQAGTTGRNAAEALRKQG